MIYSSQNRLQHRPQYLLSPPPWAGVWPFKTRCPPKAGMTGRGIITPRTTLHPSNVTPYLLRRLITLHISDPATRAGLYQAELRRFKRTTNELKENSMKSKGAPPTPLKIDEQTEGKFLKIKRHTPLPQILDVQTKDGIFS